MVIIKFYHDKSEIVKKFIKLCQFWNVWNPLKYFSVLNKFKNYIFIAVFILRTK